MRRLLPLAALALVACGSGSDSPPVATASCERERGAPRADRDRVAIADRDRRAAAARRAGRWRPGSTVPWGIAFLPDGDALVAERDSGRIVRIPAGGGKPRRVMTVPGVAAGGEGGLLGLAVSPRYARDRYVYAYLTAASRQPDRALPARRAASATC